MIELHDGRDVSITRRVPTQALEHAKMDWGRRDPLLATGDDRGTHEVVVDDVGEVVGREAVGFQDHDIGVVVLKLDLAADGIVEFDFAIMVAKGTETDDPGDAGFDLRDPLINAEIPVAGVFPIVSGKDFVGLLDFADGVKVLGGAEIRIGGAIDDHLFDDGAVDVAAFGLLIGPIGAFVAVRRVALIGNDAELAKLLDEQVAASGNGAFGVRILQTEEIDAAGLFSQGVGNEGREEASGVKKAGRGWGETSDLSPLLQAARRVFGFQIIDRHRDVGEEELS